MVTSPVHSATELAARVAASPELQEQIKENPVATITSLAAPLQTDVWIYRVVVFALGLTIVLAVIGATLLAAANQDAPQVLVALGSAAVGALAGLLAPSPAR